MAAPLDGIRVVEVAGWLAAPASTALMADLGAEVIKVEPPGGDVWRHFILRAAGYSVDFDTNYSFHLDNRGKRAITVALDRPGGTEIVQKLIASADILVTNLIQHRRERYGLCWEELRAINPRLVYVSFSGYGTRGPDLDRPGFDYAAFWARSGIQGIMAEPDAPPPLCRGGQGDHTTALNILAATLAALRLRDQTGEAQHVEITLQGTGMWSIATDFAGALVAKEQPVRTSRTAPVNPIWNSYRCADDLWILLVNPLPFPARWAAFSRLAGRPEWATAYPDMAALRAASPALTHEIEGVFATRPRNEWAGELDAADIIWAPVATLPDVINDPQVREMGWITSIDDPVFGTFETLDTPFKIYGSDIGVRGRAPQEGEHTFEVLTELGIDAEEVARLAEAGVVG